MRVRETMLSHTSAFLKLSRRANIELERRWSTCTELISQKIVAVSFLSPETNLHMSLESDGTRVTREGLVAFNEGQRGQRERTGSDCVPEIRNGML